MRSTLSLDLLLSSVGLVILMTSPANGAPVPQAGYGASNDWKMDLDVDSQVAPNLVWSQTVGEGRSQIVSNGQYVFVVSGKALDSKTDPQRLITTVIALAVDSGEQVWTYKTESQRHRNQETFSGAKPCPRATPLLHDDRLFIVSFSGQLICLNANNGHQLWAIDLVEEYGASPVQFGFSASVVADPRYPDRICVVAAGPQSGFYCLSSRDGAVIWSAECSTSSYATPVMATFGGKRQWVVVTENEVLAVEADSGKSLWSYELPEAGLTNVPTPLIVDGERLLVSGQGCQGTIALQIGYIDGAWAVKKQWATRRLQFFYTNWIKLTDTIAIGCTDKYLAAISLDSGEVLGRWRGFSNGHVLSCRDDQVLVLGGKGKLSILSAVDVDSKTELTVDRQYQLVARRCWTPLSANGHQWYLRHDDQLCCYAFEGPGDAGCLEQVQGGGRTLTLAKISKAISEPANSDGPVERIFAAFESQGTEVALELYGSLRRDGKLNEAARISLIEAARQTGQNDIAAMVLQQAMADFPASLEIKALREE